jgi:hypothetical protein
MVGKRTVVVVTALISCAAAVLFASTPLMAVTAKQGSDFLNSIAFVDEQLTPQEAVGQIGDLRSTLAPSVVDGWDQFAVDTGGQWKGWVDRRTGLLEYAEGGGLAWIPGKGNTLQAPVDGSRTVDMADLESIARGFLPQVQSLLGVNGGELELNAGRSGQVSPAVWFVDFDLVRGGMTVEGARVVFRVNHGNLIQFGSEYLPSPGAVVPKASVSQRQAMAAVSDFAGGTSLADLFIDSGSLHLITVGEPDSGYAEGFAPGSGRGMMLVWQFKFRRPGVMGTWQARVDASTGRVVDFHDVNDYGQVTGGVYLTQPSAGETVQAMPFADYGGGYADTNGNYSGSGTSSSLNGQYVVISDVCGSISQASSGGNIAFGTSGGTDCTTPGHGGSGNTHSARTQFYHLNRIKEVGRTWLPSNSWLNSKLTARVNLNQTCNAYWDGTQVNFFKSGGGCGNTGELPGVSLHEYGHGLDQNDGSGSQVDYGSGESYGDLTASLELRISCIGPGFLGSNCGGYGDSCTSCTGVRDIDYAKHSSGTPATVNGFTKVYCPAGGGYNGPCGREGHCESYVSSEAVWDLANRDLPSPGSNSAWTTTTQLWYQSRPTETKMFSCSTGSTWTSNGCFTGSLWRTFRAVDDDDGNLNNGTPNSCYIYAAFNRHGIACTTDTGANVCSGGGGCTPPAAPTGVSATASGQTQVNVSWSSSSGAASYNVYRATTSGGPYTLAGSTSSTSFSDTGRTCNTTYYYVVTAVASGGCASGNSSQASATTAACSGGCTVSTLYSNNFESGSGLSDWTRGYFGGSGSVTSWRGIKSCTAASGSHIFRYGGNGCSSNYSSNNFNFAQPNGASGISVPSGSSAATLTFNHRRQFESGYDGGTLTLSLDGSNYYFVPAADITSGASYNGTIAAYCAPSGSAGASVFTGTQSSFVSTTVDLDAACDLITGGSGGCAGQSLRIGFTSITDCSVTQDGWFLDDVTVTACTP